MFETVTEVYMAFVNNIGYNQLDLLVFEVYLSISEHWINEQFYRCTRHESTLQKRVYLAYYIRYF